MIPTSFKNLFNSSYFYADSPQMMKIALRFIKALDHEDGEYFKAGDKMKL